MVKLNKIYTRTGDGGDTSLVNGMRVSKHARRPSAFGEVDEANSVIGLVRLHCGASDDASSQDADAMLSRIQNDLFDLAQYKKQVTTIGKLIEYPEGRGWARDVEIDGSLVVETISGEMINLTSPLISEVK